MADWRQVLDRKWGSLRFGDLRVETTQTTTCFKSKSFWAISLRPRCDLELYADGLDGASPALQEWSALVNRQALRADMSIARKYLQSDRLRNIQPD